MGWLFKPGFSRKELVQERIKGWERTQTNGMVVTSTCLAHCYRGGRFSGVLWSVWERTFEKDSETVQPTERWIVCDLLRCQGGEWGYKDMDEAAHPYYYSCPLRYLDMVPINQYGGNAEWRKLVREHHQRQRQKRRQRRAS